MHLIHFEMVQCYWTKCITSGEDEETRRGRQWEALQRYHPARCALAAPAIGPLISRPARSNSMRVGNVPAPLRATWTLLPPWRVLPVQCYKLPVKQEQSHLTAIKGQALWNESTQCPLEQKDHTPSKAYSKMAKLRFLTQTQLNYHSKTPLIKVTWKCPCPLPPKCCAHMPVYGVGGVGRGHRVLGIKDPGQSRLQFQRTPAQKF